MSAASMQSPADAFASNLDRFQKALEDLPLSKRLHRANALKEAYEFIRNASERGISWKAITDAFNDSFELKMSAARLRKAFLEEIQRRKEVSGVAGWGDASESPDSNSDVQPQDLSAMRGTEGVL